jgi:hypothetical protein
MSVLDYWLLYLAVQPEYTPLKKEVDGQHVFSVSPLVTRFFFFFDKLLLGFESGEAWRIGDADADACA